MPRSFTIIQDTREKLPLVFPHHLTILDPTAFPWDRRTFTATLTVQKQTLETGDYLLQGSEQVTLIERKGSLDEVANNCLTRDGRRKFAACCLRLRSSCSKPYLILEGSPSLLSKPLRTGEPPGIALDSLLRLLAEHRIEMLLLPSPSFQARLQFGEWAARLLINNAITRHHHATDDLQQCVDH